MDLNYITYYQLENLILQRVHFKFYDLSTEDKVLNVFEGLNPYYFSFLKSLHIKTNSAYFNSDEFLTANLKESPIILIDDTGLITVDILKSLESKGYINCYVVTGGVLGLIESKSQ